MGKTPYKFTGKEEDPETGLIYFGARYYDAALGIFHGVDPLAHKFPGWSPYNYTLNNPVRLIDPDGRAPTLPSILFDEPNRRQAISWQTAKGIIEKGNYNLQGLRYTSGDATGKQVGPFGGESGGRYIFTEKFGWVDLGHFFQVAAGVQQNSNGAERTFLKYFDIGNTGVSELLDKTKDVENAQGEPSILSYEDAPSNYAGYIYSLYFYDNDENLTETLDNFFNNAGAKNPDDAPNWDQMQKGPLNYRKFQQNKSFTPVMCPDLNSGCENDGTNSYDDGNK